MTHRFTCNQRGCENEYTKGEVRDTRFCKKHQPDTGLTSPGALF